MENSASENYNLWHTVSTNKYTSFQTERNDVDLEYHQYCNLLGGARTTNENQLVYLYFSRLSLRHRKFVVSLSTRSIYSTIKKVYINKELHLFEEEMLISDNYDFPANQTSLLRNKADNKVTLDVDGSQNWLYKMK